MPRTRPLDPVEVRVIGSLLEKEQATPEYYPLTAKALWAACNQRSNREPVSDYGQGEVDAALDRLRQDVLVWRSEGARTERWQHMLDRRWELDPGKKAVMTLLLLRGPQTAGELRARSDRLHAFASVAEVDATLAALAAGDDRLVVELPRRPGQRETRWAHLAGIDDPTAGLEASDEAPAPRAAPAASAALAERVARLEEEVATLRDELERLRDALGA